MIKNAPETKFFFLAVFELLKEGEVLVVPTDNPMSEKEAWLALRDVVHGLEYRKDFTQQPSHSGQD